MSRDPRLTIRRDVYRLLLRLARFVIDPLLAGQLPGAIEVEMAGAPAAGD